MNLEIINKLYLELSQIATAKTGRENFLEIMLEKKSKEMTAAQADLAETIEQLQLDNAKLREALRRYGKHDSRCGENVACIRHCDCGFYKALGETK